MSLAPDQTPIEFALHESNKSALLLSNTIAHIVWVALPNGEVEHYNERWWSYTGHKRDKSDGMSWNNVIHPDDLAITLARWKEAIAEVKLCEIEYRLKRHDGVYRWYLGRSIPILNERGEITKWFGTATDIEDQKREHEQMKALFHEARRAVQAREELLAVVSHDLKNPLTSILMSAEMMTTEVPPSDRAAFLRELSLAITNSATQMAELIDDLLDLAKIDACQFVVQTAEHNLAAIMRDALAVLNPIAAQKNIRLMLDDLDPDLSAWLDRKRIIQVISNLVGNAIKFTEPNTVIKLKVDSNNESVTFSVTDFGPGIAECYMKKLFERYWQEKKNGRKGSGLGLAIAKGIVEAHNGTIWAESTLGAGSSFHFTLPRLKP